jgi:hypothetical protein
MICSIEEYILNQYKETKMTNKISVYNIRNQLYGGNLKISGSSFSANKRFVLKISGVWETDTSIGLTFKFMHD